MRGPAGRTVDRVLGPPSSRSSSPIGQPLREQAPVTATTLRTKAMGQLSTGPVTNLSVNRKVLDFVKCAGNDPAGKHQTDHQESLALVLRSRM